ncbi:MAG: GumC family protein [Hormoscilla sp.]
MNSKHDFNSVPRLNGDGHKFQDNYQPESNNSSDEQSLDLGWVFGVFLRRFPIMVVVALAVTAIGGISIVKQSRKIVPVYQGSFRLLVEPVTAESRVARLSLLSQSSEEVVKQGHFNISLVDYESLIRVLKSPHLMAPIITQINERYPNMSYNSLISKLKVIRVSYEKDAKTEGTSILRVGYESSEPAKIQFVLDTIAKEYIEHSIRERRASIKQGIEFIESQLPEKERRVEDLRSRIQKLREEYNLIDSNYQSLHMSIAHRQLQDKLTDLEADLRENQIIYQTLQQQFKRGNFVLILNSAPNAYSTLLKNYQEIETQISVASARLREDSLPMQSLREKQQNMRTQLRQEAFGVVSKVGDQIKALESRQQILNAAENRLNQQIQQWPYVTRQYDDLQRELEFATDRYKEFLAKLESLRIDDAQIQVPWQIIDPPSVKRDAGGKPISSAVNKSRKQLVLLVVVSTLLSVGVGFFVEIMIAVFHSPEEVKAATKLQLLGAIPFAKQFQKIEKKRKRLSRKTLKLEDLPQPELSASFLEAFRSLYTNIRLLGSKNKPIRSLAIGSPGPRDGKSTIAVQLAQTAAAIGQRVLLVDADLRHPRLHRQLGVPNLRGLSDAVKSDSSLNELIQQSTLDKNLFFLSAGQVTPDPIKLLSSPKMQYLMEQFQSFFDLVIYNTPPLVGLADGNLIAALADGIILVVRIDKTDRSLVNKALEELKISRAVILGVVVNGVKGAVSNSIAAYQRNPYKSPELDSETVL